MLNRQLKILVIDDNQDNLITLKALLGESFPEGIVYTADNGKKGIQIAFREDPDVALLDIIMPEMDGFEVCRKLKTDRNLRDIPVVFITALKGDTQHRVLALECGAEAFLSKPIDQCELTAQIRAMVKIKTANIEKRNEQGRLARLVEAKTIELSKANIKTMELLEELREENCARKISEERLNLFFQQSLIGFFIMLLDEPIEWNDSIDKEDALEYILPNLRITKVNQAILDQCDLTEDQIINRSKEDVCKQNKVKGNDFWSELFDKGSMHCHFNYYRSDGTPIWIEGDYITLYDNDNRIIGSFGTQQDVTLRKKTEKEILYLSYHDYLTGLYNRRFYEEELVRLDQPENLPLSLMMADVNGLKLVNDSFGHLIGDCLLKTAAEVIKNGVPDASLVARFGGDEFIVILTNTDNSKMEQMVNTIKELCKDQKIEGIDFSISFGYATKYHKDEKIQEILNHAEDEMYQNKLYESTSIKNKTIDLIMNTLYAKSNREMMHSKRVSEICEAIADQMKFNQDGINRIKTAGLMHDIGKMGIDEKILNKPGKLNSEECKEMQKHPEIGYRILSASSEFSEIAKYVFQHQERWDGLGYPMGIKGEEISLSARIIGVADAYDAMTSDRSYRKGFSKIEAIDEIIKKSGTQFDPEVVTIFIERVLKEDHLSY
jgi:diguanylate cyclase (GGDEF)-like protein/putative nucleotidyltransferase with HDIG domain/PAS domain S-box-containing protein